MLASIFLARGGLTPILPARELQSIADFTRKGGVGEGGGWGGGWGGGGG